MNCRDSKTTSQIEDINSPKLFEYLSGFMFGLLNFISEVNLEAQCEK